MLNFAVTNVCSVGREIYVWYRSGQQLNLYRDKTFFPYFFQLNPTGIFRTIDNKKVKKVLCSRPSDLARRRDENSYEADILYFKRYIIDKIGSFLPCELKYSFMDIEVLAKELPTYLNPIYPISCISCSNSYTGEIKTFWLNDYNQEAYSGEIKEKQLLNNFVKWIKEQQFDLLLGWNMLNFDWTYLSARYQKVFGVDLADMLSPIAANKPIGSRDKEQPLLIPAGIGIVDYLDWYKKIYRGKQSYALDNVAQDELNELNYEKVDFSRLSDKIKEKNINDVRRMMELEKKLKVINYYDELRRMSKCDWNDLIWNSKIIDMMLLSEAKQKGIILPSKHYGEGIEIEEAFEGAYRKCDTGLYKNLWKLDLSSAYPMAIINFCLDIQNIKTNEGIEINGTKFYQNSSALLPSLARKLINKKDELKKQLKSLNPELQEAKDLQIKYDAIKTVVNSLFGVCGLKIFRLFDIRVASAITFLVRDLLHYVEEKVKEQGMKVIYLDTDSLFVDAKENPKDLLNELVKQWAKEKYNKENVGIEFDLEGKFNKIFIVALCRYIGELEVKTGIKKEIKGVEVKRADSSKFTKVFQEILIGKVMNEESKEDIIKWIEKQKEIIKTLPLIEVGFPCKINTTKDYKAPPIFIRALEYTNEIIDFKKVPGDNFYYIYVEPFGTSMRKSSRHLKNKDTGEKEFKTSNKEIDKDVLAFDSTNYTHIKNVNWNKMTDRSIDSKVDKIFEAMRWEL